jgi:hypothetical protein
VATIMQHVSSEDYHPYFTYWIAIATINSFEGILQKKKSFEGKGGYSNEFYYQLL